MTVASSYRAWRDRVAELAHSLYRSLGVRGRDRSSRPTLRQRAPGAVQEDGMRPSPMVLGDDPAEPAGASTPGPLTILHVVESLGSGVATALESHLRSTPGHVHIVLGWRRQGAQTGDELDRFAADVLSLPPGRLAQLRAVRRWVERLRPDIIHAHSSYAGLYVRLLPKRLAAAVVYTPHGFSFERRDVPAPVRGAFWLAEAVLALRGACVAAVGPREAELARRLPGRRPVVYVPNVIRPLRPIPPPARGETGVPRLRLATLGRITPQKDPEFFRRLVLLGRRLELPLEWIWIGGGEPVAERTLRDAGVLVTGWSSRSAALGRLAMADVYVHTAAWEGAPVSILEAAALGLPIVARRNPALAALGLPSLFDTPEALIDTIRSLLDERRRTELSAASERLLCQHRPEAQREALEHAYALALRSAEDRRRLRPVR
jgi:glycosyltransferase involved in cell wall biosynthesis